MEVIRVGVRYVKAINTTHIHIYTCGVHTNAILVVYDHTYASWESYYLRQRLMGSIGFTGFRNVIGTGTSKHDEVEE